MKKIHTSANRKGIMFHILMLFMACCYALTPMSLQAQQDNIFWAANGSIGRVPAANPQSPLPNYITNAGNVRAIAIDASRDIIFWVSDNGTIEAADIGSGQVLNRRIVVSGLGNSITELAHEGDFVYYLNSGAGRIGRININGSGRNDTYTFTGTSIAPPSGLTVRNGQCFWGVRIRGGFFNLSQYNVLRSGTGGYASTLEQSPHFGALSVGSIGGNGTNLFYTIGTALRRSAYNSSFQSFGLSVFNAKIAVANNFVYYLANNTIGRISTNLTDNQQNFISNVGTPTALAVGNVAPAAVPSISSFQPQRVGVGRDITINGLNFINVTAVRFGNVNATFRTVSQTQIIARVPANAGTNITVVALGQNANASGFSVVPAPTLTSFTPNSAAQSEVVTLTGTNFEQPVQVFFGSVPAAAIELVSSTQIRATVGAGANGTVRVRTDGGEASQNGFTHRGAPFEIIGFRSESLPISSESDFQLNNSIMEITLRNNGSTTRNVKFVGRLKQGATVITEGIAADVPAMPIEPGEIHVFTAGDIFREGALRTPGQSDIIFPFGNYTACVSIVEASNPNQVIVPEICEEIVVPPRLSPEEVGARITKIMGFPVTITGVIADFNNYYVSGRITSVPNNNLFKWEQGREPVFTGVAIPFSQVPFDGGDDLNVTPVGGTFMLDDQEIPVTYYNWIPALLKDSSGIEIRRISPTSNVGVMVSTVMMDLDKLVRRSTQSQALQRYFLDVPNGSPLFATAGRGASRVFSLSADGRNITLNNLNPRLKWVNSPSMLTVEDKQYGTVTEMNFITNGASNTEPTAISLRSIGPFILNMNVGKTANTIETRPTTIELNDGITLTLSGNPVRTRAGVTFNAGQVKIAIQGSSAKELLLDVREATLDDEGNFVQGQFFPRLLGNNPLRPVFDTLQFDAFRYWADQQAALITEDQDDKGKPIFIISVAATVNPTARVGGRNLFSWTMPARLEFTGGGEFDAVLLELFTKRQIGTAVEATINRVFYRNAEKRLFIDCELSVQIQNLKVTAGNFIFGGNKYFSVGIIGIELKISDRFTFIGKLQLPTFDDTWGLELGGQFANDLKVVLKGTYANRNKWSLGIAVSNESEKGGWVLKPQVAFLREVRGSVATNFGRWTITIGGTFLFTPGTGGQSPVALQLVADGSISWGGSGGVVIEINGELFLNAGVPGQSGYSETRVGTARLAYDNNAKRIEGNINVKFDIKVPIAEFTGTANLLADFNRKIFYLDVNAQISVIALLRARGRFVIGYGYNTSFVEGVDRDGNGRLSDRYVTRNNFSGIYFRADANIVNIDFSFSVVIASARVKVRADCGVWARMSFNLSEFGGGAYVNGEVGVGFSVIGIGAYGEARLFLQANIGRNWDGMFFNGDIHAGLDLRVGGRCWSSCSPGCGSVRFRCGWFYCCGCGRACPNIRFNVDYSRSRGFNFRRA